jgi:ABC-type Fe3+-hydroxamate transport system substrate-binding protein
VRVSVEALVASRPEFVVVCPCGLALEQAWEETRRLAATAWWKDLPAVRDGRVAVVDGNQMFNRPGPRLVDALEFLTGFINGRDDLIPPGFPWRRLEK